LGVIFFLHKLKHIGVYVSLFAIGHSSTMLLGVYFGTNISSYLIDAIWPIPRIRPGNQDSGIRALSRRLDTQHDRLQRGRRNVTVTLKVTGEYSSVKRVALGRLNKVRSTFRLLTIVVADI
jgi:hypothetical protein